MTGRLDGKVALVFGGGSVGPLDNEVSGNGKASAIVFAREGARVFLVDINLAAVQQTEKAISEAGGEVLAQQGDATDSVSIKGAVQNCLGHFGRIDILMNNVGGSVPGGPVELEESDWQANLEFNLTSAFLGCKHVLPTMVEQGSGVILNVSSVAGLRILAGRTMAGYHASKAGLIHFTRSVALQHARQGIRANCIVPGLMNTPLVTSRIAGQIGGGDVAETIRARDAQCPTGKMGDAWDVAHAALYLASDEAKYVTATEIVVDGGLSAQIG